MRFIGVDLAWSDRNPSGFAVLEGDERGARLAASPVTITSVPAVVAAIGDAAATGPAFVAVDAPLAVPNATGRRPAEAELGRDFARFFAGAHPANRGLAYWQRAGYITGERLVELLCVQYGFNADPTPAHDARAARRLVFETYPHPAIVSLFALNRRLLYKRGDPAQRIAGLSALRGLVAEALPRVEPPLCPSPELAAFCAEDLTGLRGRARKGYEDRLDGLICAYLAYYYWYWGDARCRMYGNVAEGHIITPRPPEVTG